jgi:hypothetical protein
VTYETSDTMIQRRHVNKDVIILELYKRQAEDVSVEAWR